MKLPPYFLSIPWCKSEKKCKYNYQNTQKIEAVYTRLLAGIFHTVRWLESGGGGGGKHIYGHHKNSLTFRNFATDHFKFLWPSKIGTQQWHYLKLESKDVQL